MLSDVRYALRLMARTPMFTGALVLTVALAIGANTAMFSVVNAVLRRSVPFSEPDRLMQVAEKNDALNISNFGASVLNYLSWSERTRTFERLGAVGFATFNVSGGGDPEQIVGNTISPSVMPILGLQPLAGRSFVGGEDRPGASRVVMIGEGLWKRRYGGDPSLVGRTITLDGAAYTVVGIAPPALKVLTGGDAWVPLTIDPAKEIRLNHVIFVVGRLKPGVTQAQAQAEMDAIAAAVGREYPEVKDWGIRLITIYRAQVSQQLETALLVLWGAVGCVLLIACANVANLLLARAVARQKEMAVRTAIGAGRGRLVRQLLFESLVLSALGGGVGVVAAAWAVAAINRALPPNLLPVPDVHIDGTVLLFAFAATIGTGVLFGLAPALHAARGDVNTLLKQSARTGAHGRSPLRSGLVASELAIATVLLIGAGLLVQSLVELQRVRLGFRPDGLLTFQVSLPASRYPGPKAPAFYQTLLDSLRSVPGVRDAAVSSGIPLGAGNYTSSPFETVGQSIVPPGTAFPLEWRTVSPTYFRALGIPLVRGRAFTDADGPTAAPVIVVSQSAARKFWGDADPIGRTVRRVADKKEFTVVGVVGNVRSTALTQEGSALYYPAAIRVWALMDVVVRSEGDPQRLLPAVRQKVRELDAEVPLANVRTMDEWVSNNAAQPRLNAVLLAAFAIVALAIAAVGTYGVLAYSVSQRTREIGLRLALGAPRGRVVRLIVREGMTIGTLGIGIGLASAYALSGALGSLVFGVRVHDPATFAAVSAALAIVALAACTLPALRAARVDPMVSLRDD